MKPVTLITGSLGAGKTTLLRALVKSASGAETLVVLNEYGEVGLEEGLVRFAEDRIRVIAGGCLCCQKRDDLVDVLRSVVDDEHRGLVRYDRVIIELSGLAEPAPVAFTLATDPFLRHQFKLARVLTVVDATRSPHELRPEVARQVMLADHVVLSKTDLVEPRRVLVLRDALRALNPIAPVRPGYDLQHEDATPDGAPRAANVGLLEDHEDGHTAGVRSVVLSPEGRLDWSAFSLWLSLLLHVHGEKVLRVKGLVDVGLPGPLLVHAVQHVVSAPEQLASWAPETACTQLVLLVNDLDPELVRRSFQAFRCTPGRALATVSA